MPCFIEMKRFSCKLLPLVIIDWLVAGDDES